MHFNFTNVALLATAAVGMANAVQLSADARDYDTVSSLISETMIDYGDINQDGRYGVDLGADLVDAVGARLDEIMDYGDARTQALE